VLADRYADEFTDNITSHDMVYVKSTEKVLPLSSNFVDIVFTFNALDHVYNLYRMCNEILRILKPGGTLIGSFNLEEPATQTEPQRLTEGTLRENLLNHLDIESYRLSRKEPEGDTYARFPNGTPSYESGDEGSFGSEQGNRPPEQRRFPLDDIGTRSKTNRYPKKNVGVCGRRQLNVVAVRFPIPGRP
jgi:SAM-dependent methyltransferase